jgi:hypothetical protein
MDDSLFELVSFLSYPLAQRLKSRSAEPAVYLLLAVQIYNTYIKIYVPKMVENQRLITYQPSRKVDSDLADRRD